MCGEEEETPPPHSLPLSLADGPRKLFGGYRITPRFCTPTRQPEGAKGAPNVCMFNHECIQRNGQVVGACMDGFLFGACCQLPVEVPAGELLNSDLAVVAVENNLSANPTSPTKRPETTPTFDITSSGVSQITASLLNPSVLPTAQDNAVIQTPDTLLLSQQDNEIDPGYFMPTNRPVTEDRKTTVRNEETTMPYPNAPIVHISISNAPVEYTTASGFNRPMFRPKPSKPSEENYVLVPTISHESSKPNKTQEHDSVVNIIQMLNTSTSGAQTSTLGSTNRPPSTSYVSVSTPTRRPVSQKVPTTTPKPPSTSYVFSTTIPPRRTTTSATTTTKKKPPPKRTRPTRITTRRPDVTVVTKRPSSNYAIHTSPSKTTVANSPAAFVTTLRPPSTSRSVVQREFDSALISSTLGQYASYPSPAPTVIVLGPVTENEVVPELHPVTPTTYEQYPVTIHRPTLPQSKPINQVTINNHVTQNIYSTSESPSPTVLITPKPSITSSVRPQEDTVEIVPPPDEFINFPPVRNPNLNMSSIASLNEDDITTPGFIEDAVLDSKVESFVNKIIQGLQEPFHDLKDIVYSRNKTSSLETNHHSSDKKQTTTTKKRTTKKPVTTTESLIDHQADNTAIDSEDYRTQCGVRPLVKTGRIVGGKGAVFGEFPWQVLVRESTWLGLFTKNKCGGVLISNRYVMTAAHCQPGFLASLVAVFGEFDISGDLESKRPISRNVKRVIVHRQYDPATFENDLALLELEHPVLFDAHIIPICLPRDAEDFTGRMATVTGWGRLKYGGGVPSVLQEVQVPIMENHMCQEMFKAAGHPKVILDSFLCAGYVNGEKDSCEAS
ncbi:hypothetical protein NQ318_008614 [Aromia moschata]|uniref:Peptidase S1 domain-containing protein n=1 Tax=Aromia moschata TaxID=1265417 RepID=A0AAV8YYD5_9CUCU|nr:hypothetical protein NQ318_008614 [Aromia moschata]